MKYFLYLLSFILLSELVLGKVDPNFYIFICFGQSNMEGQGDFREEDKVVDERFKMMPALEMPQLKREAKKWYRADPPLNRQDNHMGPVDFFGRTMVENLPEEINIGTVTVACGGSAIEIFDDELIDDYLKNGDSTWAKPYAEMYGGSPYKVLIDTAKEAQKYGVIKGILLHQGESNNGDKKWPEKVKKVYNNILKDLNLKGEEVPLLAGEVVSKEEGGQAYAVNDMLATFPDIIPNSYVISSEGCTSKGDGYHFNTEGYEILGGRYADKMLELLGIKNDTKKEVEVDPNFYIFLCLGQSNMVGQGDIRDKDKKVDERFKMMAAIDMTESKRKQGNWYRADPPLCVDWAKMSPADFFGRTLVEELPKKITVGVINVAAGGMGIEVFDEDKVDNYLKTLELEVPEYDNHPYKILIERAKEAQKVGVIKGILLHQGESNIGDKNWPKNVKIIYERILDELKLKSENVPLLVGEVVTTEEGGVCGDMNEIIDTIPDVISTAYVISSKDCTSKGDGYHFDTEGCETLGKRYAEKMLKLLDIDE